jgi:hypothetical protein
MKTPPLKATKYRVTFLGFLLLATASVAHTRTAILQKGGTDLNSCITGGVLVGNTGASLFRTAGGSREQALASNGAGNNPAWQSHNAYDVRNYGALFDGSTDDTISIQLAINAAHAAGGGIVVLPRGSTKISSLSLYDNVSLQGQGVGATALTENSSSITAALYSSTSIAYVALKGFSLVGQGDTVGYIYGIKIGTGTGSASKFINIQDVLVDGFSADNIWLGVPIISTIERVYTKNAGGDGIYAVNGTSLNIRETYATGNNRAGYHMDTMTYGTIEGTAAEYNTYGYFIEGGGNLTLNGTGSEVAMNASSTIPIVAHYRIAATTNLTINSSYSTRFAYLLSKPAYHYYISKSAGIALNEVRGFADLGGAENYQAPTNTVLIDATSKVIARYPNFTGQIGSGVSGLYSTLIDTSGNVGLNLSSVTRGKLEVVQTTNSTAGGLAITNRAQTGSSRLWVDVNGVQRHSSGPSENGLVAINGNGPGKVGIQTITPHSAIEVGTPDNTTASYTQIDAESGAPMTGDCNEDIERGRMILDYTDNRLYVCNGATRGWDYSALTD